MVLIETTCCIRRQQGKGHFDDVPMYTISDWWSRAVLTMPRTNLSGRRFDSESLWPWVLLPLAAVDVFLPPPISDPNLFAPWQGVRIEHDLDDCPPS